MSRSDKQVASDAVAQLRNQARQASWTSDPAGWAKDVLGVHLWSKQQEIADSLINNKRTVVSSCHGTGKALDVETLIPVPGGDFVRMGDIRPGMQVLGSEGQPVNVSATTGVHTADRYAITFRGPVGYYDVIASGDHIWPVMMRREKAMAEVACERAGLPVHTGLWHHRTRNIDTRTIADLVRSGGRRILVPAEQPEFEVRGTRWEPDERISRLLEHHGDTDPTGRAALKWSTHHSSSPPADLILARIWFRERGVHTLLHRQRRNSSLVWSLGITGDAATQVPVHPDAKALAVTHQLAERGLTGHPGWEITRIRRIEDGEVQCIQVDSPDHLFLCGEMRIPTHNSMIASVLACWWISTRPVGEAIVVSCYTDDTEVLTKDGWKLFKDVATGPDGDEFATRSPETKAFEWQHAFRYYEAPWDGEVVDIKGRSTDLRVTPNHRMLVQWSTYTNGKKTVGETFKRADAIGTRGADLPALSEWEGKTPETVSFGRYTWSAVDFAAFLGAWMAEGSLGPPRRYAKKGGYGGSIAGDISEYGGAITISQETKSKGYEPYRELLTRMIGQEPCRSSDRQWVFNCQDLYRYLEKLGKAHEKYVPEDVKNWGPEALEAFLRHYLLGDGWFQKSQGKRAAEGYGSWRACTVSKRLADDLQEIAQKVGKFATIKERSPRDGGSFGDRKILEENCRTGYYLVFGDSQTRRIKPSRSHYKGNVYCVSVPNESLYVRRGGSPVWCGNTAPTYAQVNKILWEEIRRHHATAKLRDTPLVGYATQGDEWKSDSGQILAFGRKPATGDRHGFHGIHRRYVLVILDEACGVPEEIWTGVEAITTTDGCRILAIGNPDDRNTEFGNAFLREDTAQDWHRIKVPASSTPNFTGEPVPRILNEVLVSRAWCEERRRAWGEKDPRYIAKVMAEFPDVSKSSLFPPSLVSQAFEDVPFQPVGSVVRLGVDVARFGTDKNVVISLAGVTAQIEDSWTGTDTVSSAHKVLQIAQDVKDRLKSPWVEIRVDAVGLGAGVVDTLNARAVLEKNPWFSVYEMHGSASPPVDVGGSVHGYGNARAYWFDQLRQSLRNGRVRVGVKEGMEEHTEQLKDDLGLIFYKFKSGRLFIISKEEMRAQHGRSPDYADALTYATAPVTDSLPAGSTLSESAGNMAHGLEDMDDLSDLSISPF